VKYEEINELNMQIWGVLVAMAVLVA